MIRFVWSQLRHRAGRTVALLLGVLAATSGFTVLTGATETSQLVVRHTVEENARGTYDILVRPAGGQGEYERQHESVRPNFLADQSGGIDMDQWRQIRDLPGVEVAAPAVSLGYIHWNAVAHIDLTAAVDPSLTRQLLTVHPTWVADRGLTKAPDEVPGFVYVTRRPVAWPVLPEGWLNHADFAGEYSDGVRRDPRRTFERCGFEEAPYEVQEDGHAEPICAYGPDFNPGEKHMRRVFRHVAQVLADGRFLLDGGRRSTFVADILEDNSPVAQPGPRLTVPLDYEMPLLLGAIDPTEEAALVGLDRAVVDGGYLTDNGPPKVELTAEYEWGLRLGRITFPALLSTRPFLDEQVVLDVRRLAGAPVAGRSSEALNKAATDAAGTQVLRQTVDAADEYASDLPTDPVISLGKDVLQAGPTGYVSEPDGSLRVTPQDPVIRQRAWTDRWDDSPTPLLSRDVAARPMFASRLLLDGLKLQHLGDIDDGGVTLQRAGAFDPGLLRDGSGLVGVPLETYRLPEATGADTRSRQLLGDQPLWPNNNPGGYQVPPPALLINLNQLEAVSDDPAPISAIRVRVTDIGAFDATSRERIRLVAQDITARTGLDVDIMYGSSPTPQTIHLPPGSYGRPDLALTEYWSRKGIAAMIVTAIDQKSVILFVLILVVSAMFLANAVSAAVRDRRRELATLACLGWPAHRLAAAILTEVATIGLVAGGLAAATTPLLGAATNVTVSTPRALAAIPIALGLALTAGAIPALRAARTHPASGMHPTARTPRRTRHLHGLTGLAASQATRVPGRTILAATALAIGVAAVTILTTTTLVFHGTVVGSLLGDAVSLHARGVDIAATAGIVTLAAVCIADVLYLNIRERAAELATLRATGWTNRAILRLIGTEAAIIGTAGAALGAAAGAVLTAALTHTNRLELATIAAATTLAGILIALSAAAFPALTLRHQPPGPHLAEE